MPVKKKDSSPAEQSHICYVCGKIISGDHVYIKTKRGSELHIHNECAKGENHGGGKQIL